MRLINNIHQKIHLGKKLYCNGVVPLTPVKQGQNDHENVSPATTGEPLPPPAVEPLELAEAVQPPAHEIVSSAAPTKPPTDAESLKPAVAASPHDFQ